MLVMLDGRQLSIEWRWFHYRVIEHLPDGQRRRRGAFRTVDAAVRRMMDLVGPQRVPEPETQRMAEPATVD